MGSTYTVTTDDNEDAAIAFIAGDPNVDKQAYLEACVHGQLLQPWTNQYLIATAPVPPVDVATSYATATPEQQDEIHAILGLTPTTPPPDGGGTPPAEPTVVNFNYTWSRQGLPPPTGQVRTDGADWALAVTLGLADMTADVPAQDVTGTLSTVTTGTTVHIQDAGSNSVDMTINGAGTDTGTATTWPVSVSGSAGAAPTNGTAVVVTLTIPAPAA